MRIGRPLYFSLQVNSWRVVVIVGLMSLGRVSPSLRRVRAVDLLTVRFYDELRLREMRLLSPEYHPLAMFWEANSL